MALTAFFDYFKVSLFKRFHYQRAGAQGKTHIDIDIHMLLRDSCITGQRSGELVKRLTERFLSWCPQILPIEEINGYIYLFAYIARITIER